MVYLKVRHDPIANSKELMLRKNMDRKTEGLTSQNDFTGPLDFVLV